MRYAKPDNLGKALELLGQDSWRILAGGTDFYPAQGNRPFTENVLDINGLDDLRGIRETPDHVTLGARATWTEVLRQELPPAFAGLRQAAREVGSVQIQNTATVAGNLCNASPAADGVPPLLTLDAEVELSSLTGIRLLPLVDFVVGNRQTRRRPDELLTAIRIPRRSIAGASAFRKLGARRYLVISIAMVAVRVEIKADGTIAEAAVAVGACSAVARRLRGLEARLPGLSAAELPAAVAAEPMAELSPIEDVRGSAEYRRDAARELVVRALADVTAVNRPAARVAA